MYHQCGLPLNATKMCAGEYEKGKLNYNTVVQKYPQFKEDIDLILLADGYVVNEDGTVTEVK